MGMGRERLRNKRTGGRQNWVTAGHWSDTWETLGFRKAGKTGKA